MIATTEGAALVKGVAPGPSRTVKVKVTRAFCMQGKRLEAGATLDVPEALARELASNGKAVPHAVEKAAAKPAAKPQEKE